jgi:glutathione S-transferase
MVVGTDMVLVSHALCPYVQRVAIVLAEKGLAFERREVDLGRKPDWFKRLSPLGKTPVLMVDGEAIFESAVICEYLEDAHAPALHPADPLRRARHRAWMEFGSALLNTISAFYTAPDEATLQAKASDIHARLEQLEVVLVEGPYFSGAQFCIVDAVFGPVFRYFDLFDRVGDFGFWSGLPKLRRT